MTLAPTSFIDASITPFDQLTIVKRPVIGGLFYTHVMCREPL